MIPRKIYIRGPTGYKGSGPTGRIVLNIESKEEQIEELRNETNDDSLEKAKKLYKKGWRFYTRYVDRYGIRKLRSPGGKLFDRGEQWG